jgi:HPt (histidine-containing phosphotransfer) domain-containing protein
MIDWKRVDILKRDVGVQDFGEVVDLFLEEVTEALIALETTQKPEEVKNLMHFLKGSTVNIGFAKMNALCREGEALANKGQVQHIPLARIKQAFADSKLVFFASNPLAA